MVSLDSGYQTAEVNDVTPTEGSVWFHSAYPFRIALNISIVRNYIYQDEKVTVHIPSRFVKAKKIRADLQDIIVSHYDGKAWTPAPTSCEYVDDGDTIAVHFQALEDIIDFETYYLYYGNSKLINPPETEPFTGEDYHNTTTLTEPYVSFTNPSQDWEIEPDHIIGSRPGAKLFSEMSAERFRFIGRKGPDAGILDIRVDGVLLGAVDLFADEEELGVEIFSYELPEPEYVQIRLDISRNKNVSSSGNVVRLDNIRYDTYAAIIDGPEEINPNLDWMSNMGAKT